MDLSLKAILDELTTRVSTGPMQFRFILQPTMAAILGVRAGLVDATTGMPPFIWGLLSGRAVSKPHLEIALRHVAVPILIAAVLDAIVQYTMFRHVHPLAALIVGTVLMALPYAVVRGLSNRIKITIRCRARAASQARSAPHST